MRNLFALYFTLTIAMFSCTKEYDPDLCSGSNCYDDGIFILNEGLFQSLNASVTYYHPQEMTSENDIFYENNQLKVGDILQSGYKLGTDVFLVVNNSQKVLRVDASTFTLVSTISISGSPRHFLAVSDQKAYVTDLFGDIHIVDIPSSSVTSTISQNGWTEEMIHHGNYVYVCKRFFNSAKSQLLKLNIQNDQIEDSLQLRPNAGSLVQDANNNIWVICSGDTADEDSSALIQIDIDGFSVLKTVGITDRTTFGGPSEVYIDGSRQMLYYLNVDLYRMDVASNVEPVMPFIFAGSANFYDFVIDPESNEVYICNAVDFLQQGRVLRYDNNGSLVDEFQVGIAPTDIVFNY